jgi:hypothetical protein
VCRLPIVATPAKIRGASPVMRPLRSATERVLTGTKVVKLSGRRQVERNRSLNGSPVLIVVGLEFGFRYDKLEKAKIPSRF